MHLRAVLTVVNFAVVAAALAIFFLAPAFATVAVYAVLIWMFSSLVIFYTPFGNRQIRPTGPPLGPASGSSSSAGSSADAPLLSSGIGFCIYCGTHLAAGATICPTCGRTVRIA